MSPPKGELPLPKFNMSDFMKSLGWDSILDVICLPGLEVGIPEVDGMFWYDVGTEVRMSGLTIEPSPLTSVGIDEAIKWLCVDAEVQGFVNWTGPSDGGWKLPKLVCMECRCWLSRAISKRLYGV